MALRIARRLVLTVAVMVMAVATGAGARADETARLDHLFGLMRMEETMRGYPEALLEGMDEHTAWDGPLARDDVRVLAEKHFSSDVLIGDLKRLMAGRMSARLIDREIAFFETEFGKRLVTLEVAASAPELEETVDLEGGRIYRDLVASGAPRVELIHRVIDGAALVDWGMATAMNLSYAMLSALAGDQMTDEQIIAAVNAGTGGMRPELTRIANAFVAYTYRSLSDAELKRYVEQYESPDGRLVMKTVMDTYRIVLVERSRAFGYDLRALMQQRRS